jgi:uncharacterized protein (TIGR02145 family)
MRKKTLFWMPALILLISAASVNAQVIIGGSGTDEPHAGAGLDLSPLGTQKLGLLLPNVALTNDAAEFALVAEATPGQKTDARGMLVYNAADVLDGKGLYLWDGVKWQGIALAPTAPIEDYSTVIDAEGNTYSAAKFGDAGWWMTQNLRTTTGLTENGNPDYDTSNKYYWYPNSNSGVSATTADDILDAHPEYGLLYTWAAASGRTGVNGNEENSSHGPHQGICPAGWHLPSDMEWNQLEQVISESAQGVYSASGTITWNVSAIATGWRGTHGQKMKSETTVDSQTTNGTSKSRTANGFDALLVGFMYSGSPTGYGTYTAFWSSSSTSSTNAWYRYLYTSGTGVNRYDYGKDYMFSVRCKKTDS